MQTLRADMPSGASQTDSDEGRTPSVARVDLGAIAANARALKAKLAPGTKFLAAVKANAYGHGAVPVARALLAEGTDWLAVATLAEGRELREAGIGAPVLLMQGIRPDQAAGVVAGDFATFVYDAPVLEALSAAASAQAKRARVHIKVDTGMTRLGVMPQELGALLEKTKSLPNIEIEGICSHLSVAEDAGGALTALQKQRFAEALSLAENKGVRPALRHLANSSATILDPETHYDMVRCGIAVYGEHPAVQTRGKIELQPALAWTTQVHQLKRIAAGEIVSYGATWKAQRESLIAVVPVGYGDGYRRNLSNRARMIAGGKSCPVVGIVCMDLTMIDVTDVPGIVAGDEVTVIGATGGEHVSAAELAEILGTISYEVLTGIGARVARVYR
ncbi:MAG: alanine racemase [Chrysiogenetes bacterium]|nr:alanine racemase [Chrysiogenetes bacterium]